MGTITDKLTGMLMPEMDLSALMGMYGGFGNFGFYAPSPVEEEKLFDLAGSTLMTVSPQDTVSLTITLDEQDISKVSVGQKATVKVLALSGETFDAEVVEVSNHGTNSGGSSKFTAKLRLNKTADMIDGMSATASLELQTKETIPLIPVAALAQQGAKTVVFTALDKETGEPAKPVPVTLGVSDGTNVEILEGLKPGDCYYYSYYDPLELDTGVEDRFTLR
jgi:multidrug efflux pump subunit AcrA (membrane-fusion protein)